MDETFNPIHGIALKPVMKHRHCEKYIEIPKGSKGKYEMDKLRGCCGSTGYCFHPFIIRQTMASFLRHIVMIMIRLTFLSICSIDVYPMCIVEAKVIGAMEMVDGEERDDKIIAVAGNDMSVNYLNDLQELPPHTLVELKRFFEDYKMLEHKNIIVDQFLNREKAYEIILEGMTLYQAKKETLAEGFYYLRD